MRVAVDARLAGRGLGIATFVRELVKCLVKLPDMEIVWFGDGALAPPGTEARTAYHWPYPLLDSRIGQIAARRSGAEIFHFTGNSGWQRAGAIPTVLTIHDLDFVETGPWRRSARQYLGHSYWRRGLRRAIRGAGAIAVPSRATASRLEQAFPGVRPVVISDGVAAPRISNRRDHTAPYVVAFGGRDPRKGLDLVLSGLREAAPTPYRLKVLAGAGLPNGFETRAAPELAAGQLELLGYVPRDELWRILAAATALVYPSTAEGFGLPPIEAMALGVPVITGLTAATAEIGGDAILAIDPADPVRSIAFALRRLRDEPALMDALAKKGRGRASQFTWERSAAQYASLYSTLAAG